MSDKFNDKDDGHRLDHSVQPSVDNNITPLGFSESSK